MQKFAPLCVKFCTPMCKILHPAERFVVEPCRGVEPLSSEPCPCAFGGFRAYNRQVTPRKVRPPRHEKNTIKHNSHIGHSAHGFLGAAASGRSICLCSCLPVAPPASDAALCTLAAVPFPVRAAPRPCSFGLRPFSSFQPPPQRPLRVSRTHGGNSPLRG